MAEQNNQFFLAVTATVALVSIVALVILVLNAANPQVNYVAPTLESAGEVQNVAGDTVGRQGSRSSRTQAVSQGNICSVGDYKCFRYQSCIQTVIREGICSDRDYACFRFECGYGLGGSSS